MYLYHYTQPANVPMIAREGLKPDAREEHAFMANSVPVVWLTQQESIIATAADVAHIKACCGDDQPFKEGELLFGGPARLTVRVERHNKRLMRYTDFLHLQGADMDWFQKRVRGLDKWWVYLGVIAPRKIDTTIPAALAVECFDHHIATHPDAGARDRFKAMREQAASLAPDHPVSFSNAA